MTHGLQDLRFALRQLRRSPGFAVTAVLTLALGIGANTAIFSLLDQALLRSLPVREPERLVILSQTSEAWNGHTSNNGQGAHAVFSYPMYRDLQDKSAALEGLLATAPARVGLSTDGKPQIGRAELVSGNYFRVLGVPAQAGRVFAASDDLAAGANPVAVLSYRYWQSLGGYAGTVGHRLDINGHPFTVVGVAARGFQSAVWGETPDVFLPMSMLDTVVPGKGKRLTDHSDRWLSILGRLRPDVPADSAAVALAPLWHALRLEEVKLLGNSSPRFEQEFVKNSRLQLLAGSRGLSYNRDSMRMPLLIVAAMAALVLLIAAVNVASLLLVRSASRVREFSMRYALGASTRQIILQLLLEGSLIGCAGAGAGLLLAPLAARALVREMTSGGSAVVFSTGLDLRLLAFTLSAGLLVSVITSIAPAWSLRRPDLTQALRQQSATAAGAGVMFRRVIVGLQVGLSVVLLVGATLFVRSMRNLRHVDPGMDLTQLITFHIDPLLAGVPQEHIPLLQQSLLESFSADRRIQSAGATNDGELTGNGMGGNLTVEGYSATANENVDAEVAAISPQFLSTMRERLVAGRWFTDDDDPKHPSVAIVNETLAKHYFRRPDAAVGRRVARGAGNQLKFMTIVGVVADARHSSLRSEVQDTLYQPLKQIEKPNELYVYLRTSMPLNEAGRMIQQNVRAVNGDLAIANLRTMTAQVDETLRNDSLIESLAIAFGALAALLAGVGLYGVLAYTTAQRTREIGIRIALGSSRLQASGLVLRDVSVLVSAGVVLALPCALLLARLIRSQLFGVSAADPLTLVAVVLNMLFVALVAAAVPARRAASVDPVVALRSE